MNKPLIKGSNIDFWKDCYEEKKSGLKFENFPLNNYPFYRKRKENFGHKNNKLYSSFLLYQQNTKKVKNKKNSKMNKTKIPNIKKICDNHPIIKEFIKPKIKEEEKELMERRKKAMFRCLGLYVYGLEFRKAKQLENERDKQKEINNELSFCTFRPKITDFAKTKKSQYLLTKKTQNHIDNNINNLNNLDMYYGNNMQIKNAKRRKYKSIDSYYNDNISLENEECTFKPKISKNDFKKIFDKSKSLANEKDNAEYFLRLNNARKKYMIKKFSLLPTKDDSYDYTLFTITNRMNNNKQSNNSTIDVYDLKFNKKYKGRNLSISYHKDNSSSNKKQINIDKNIKFNLRKALLSIDLDEEN
jgi:hypothetical protein